MDSKQKLRLTRALQAMAEASIQTVIAALLFQVGAFWLELTGFVLLMAGLWVGHTALVLIIRFGVNQRFADPSMTREQVVWSIFTLLITIFFMQRFRPLMMMFFPMVLIFGAFRMNSRQYLMTSLVMIIGYFAVILLSYRLHPGTMDLEYEIIVAIVFALIVVAFSFISNEISLLRRKLNQRNGELASAMARIEQMAVTDALTGISNRRHMMMLLGQQKAIADRGGAGFCTCYFDLDHFKRINDGHGHLIGDKVLMAVGDLLNRLFPDSLAARFGGEEFVVLLHGDNVPQRAEQLRAEVERLKPGGVDVTLSLGLAAVAEHPGKDLNALLGIADQALYGAKAAGRNQVCLTLADGNICPVPSRSA